MHGDIGRIPIISLSGCKSLSDILSELPLPQPLPKSLIGSGLVDDPQIIREIQLRLQTRGGFLVESISNALATTSTDGINLKESNKAVPIDFHTLPPLLKEAISRRSNILEENRSFECIYTSKEVLQILSGEAGKCSSKMTSPVKANPALVTAGAAAPVQHRSHHHHHHQHHQQQQQHSMAAPVKLTLKTASSSSSSSSHISSTSTSAGGAPVATSNAPTTGGTVGTSVYSVTSFQPLKLSIKRARIDPSDDATAHSSPKKARNKRRSKNTATSGTPPNMQNWGTKTVDQSVTSTMGPPPIHQVVQSPPVAVAAASAAVVTPVQPAPHLSAPVPHPLPPNVQLTINAPPASSVALAPSSKDALLRNSCQLLNSAFNQLLASDHESSNAMASLLSGSDGGQSIGTPTSINNVSVNAPRSPPLSVPSNSSYPATPGGIIASIPSIPPTTVTGGGGHLEPSPEEVGGCSGVKKDAPPPPPPPPPPQPRGLSAYLQKPRQTTEVVAASPSEADSTSDAYARQHGSVPPMSNASSSSPWTTERRSGGAHGAGHPAVVNAAGAYPASSSSLTSTPNGQEGTKEKRSRRRRSELEELKNWQIRDQTHSASSSLTTTPNKKPQHIYHHNSIPPTIVEDPNCTGTSDAPPTASRLASIPSDTEGAAFFTEPLGERVKRRRQQHRTPPTSSTNAVNETKHGASKRLAVRGGEDTSSELSMSPRRGAKSFGLQPKRRHHHHHQHQPRRLSFSESEDEDEMEVGAVEQRNNGPSAREMKALSVTTAKSKAAAPKEDGDSSSSCLTDSPVPHKHSLQRLVQDSKGRPPSLPRIENQHLTPMSTGNRSTQNSASHHHHHHQQHQVATSGSPSILIKSEKQRSHRHRHHRLQKERRSHHKKSPRSSFFSNSSSSSHSSSSDALSSERAVHRPTAKAKKTAHNPMTLESARSSSKRRRISETQVPQKRHKVKIQSSSSSSSSSSHSSRANSPSVSSLSSASSSSSFPERLHKSGRASGKDGRNKRHHHKKHPSQSSDDSRRKPALPPPRRSREATPSTDPCTDSNAMKCSDAEIDELSRLKAETSACSPFDDASSEYSVLSLDLSDSMERAEMVIEAERRIAEEITKFAAAATHFSENITQFLQRVGGLDLSKAASDMSAGAKRENDEMDGEGVGSEDQTPVEARLSRREVNTLFHEAEVVRVAGSISNEPNGRLVRFLNLLRINILDAVALAAPNPTVSAFKGILQRRKTRLGRRDEGTDAGGGGGGGGRSLISESVLWAHPVWMRVLRGLDSALIALHIITGPDVPRGRLLAMEELVEAITAITHFHFNQLITVVCTPPNDSKRFGPEVPSLLTSLVRDRLGSRLGEALCGLASLVRLHPGRFTDTLILHLADLATRVISSTLVPPGGTVSSTQSPSAANIFPVAVTVAAPLEQETPDQRHDRCVDYCEQNTWRLQLQRSALALTSSIFMQYEKHRHLVASDLLANLVYEPLKVAGNKNSASGYAKKAPAMRNIWILASSSFSSSSANPDRSWEPFLSSISSRSATNSSSSSSGGTPSCVSNAHFLRVHPLSAVVLALVQGLIPAPSHAVCAAAASASLSATGRRSSSAGAPATPSSGVSQQSAVTATGGWSDQQHGGLDANQLAKEEKVVCGAYASAVRTSQFLLNDMLKKFAGKGEENLRPLLETLLIDLLRVAADAPVEWPAASVILLAFSQFLLQQANGTPTSSRSQTPTNQATGSSSSSKSSNDSTRLLALDCIVILTQGLFQLEQIRGAKRRGRRFDDVSEARSALMAFLSSPVLGLYHLTLTVESDSMNAQGQEDHVKLREYAYTFISRLRYSYFDGLTLAARRFHLVSWLHETNQELTSVSLPVNEERRKHLEEVRRSLLAEFASTHYSIAGLAPWLPPTRCSGGGVSSSNRSIIGGGGGGLISPAASETGAGGVGVLSDNRLALYTGYGVGADSRRRKTARAHRLATRIAAKGPIGFEVLYMQIIKMVYDTSLQIRTRALRGLSTLIEACPGCIPPPSMSPDNSDGTHDASSQSLKASDLLTIAQMRLTDNSPMVREAAVDLASKLFTLRNNPAFPGRIFKTLLGRVLDLQIGVRKRAVKCLQNLLLRHSETGNILSHEQQFDASVTLLKRSNDEDETIKKTVLETFMSLWFTPVSNRGCTSSPPDQLEKRVQSLCEIFLTVRSLGSAVVEDFMNSILNQEDPERRAQVDAAGSEIVEFLVKTIQRFHTANWHTRGCPLNPKNSRNRVSSPKPHCSCTSQPEVLTLANTFLLLDIMAKSRAGLLLSHVPYLVQVIPSLVQPGNSGAHLDANNIAFAIEIIQSCCLHISPERGSQFRQLFPNGTGSLEDYLIFLLQRHIRVVVDASISCLAVIANRLTKDYSRVTECFAHFYESLIQERKAMTERLKKAKHGTPAGSGSVGASSNPAAPSASPLKGRPKLLRALYTVGLICKHFSLEDLANAAFELVNKSRNTTDSQRYAVLTHQAMSGKNNREEVFATLMFFAETAVAPTPTPGHKASSSEDAELVKKATAGLSFLANRHEHLFRSPRLEAFFKDILAGTVGAANGFSWEVVADLQVIVLDCINDFLVEEERRMIANDSNWLEHSKHESLKQLGEMTNASSCSGGGPEVSGSTVAQTYVRAAVAVDNGGGCAVSAAGTVRGRLLALVATAQRRGLLHPAGLVGALVCLAADPDAPPRAASAAAILRDIAARNPGFLLLKCAVGIRRSFELQCAVASLSGHTPGLIRGARICKSEESTVASRPLALCHVAYSLLQPNKNNRRSLISTLLYRFDMEHNDSWNLSPPRETNGGGDRHRRIDDSVEGGGSGSGSSGDSLAELVYLCDHLAHFPYKTLDEIYYLARTLDLRISAVGSAVVRSLQDCLAPSALLRAEAANPNAPPSTTEPSFDRKVMNLLEDAETELFGRSTNQFASAALPTEIGPIEGKLIDRINRPVAAEKRLAFREKVIRHAPSCLLQMALRKFLQDAYDVTPSKLNAFTSSGSASDEKSLQRPIPAPSARALNSGAVHRLVDLPGPLVSACLLDSAWPRSSASRLLRPTEIAAPTDATILRLALLLHRQLLSVDGADDALMMMMQEPAVVAGPAGDGTLPSKKSREGDKSKDKLAKHKDMFSSSKLTSQQQGSTPTKGRLDMDEQSDDNNSVSSAASAMRKAQRHHHHQQPQLVSNAPSSLEKQHYKKQKLRRSDHTSASPASTAITKPSSPSSKNITKLSMDGVATTSKHSSPNSMPKKDSSSASAIKSVGSKCKASLSDAELSSLSSVDDCVPQPRQQQHSQAQPFSSSSSSNHKRPSGTPGTSGSAAPKKPAVARPRYDLAPLPGTPDIRTQQEQRRKARALAAKKQQHLLAEKQAAAAAAAASAEPKGRPSTTADLPRREATEDKGKALLPPDRRL